ncbi:c-type cytochrome [Suttonella ornithocola]|uniref:Cytochrome c5 n=1 Tax=Suttonella ornithocola TaxID=279832 RepID=A0A380N1T3_9GAMM|nr:c-type cytochrome [Suttonella ornithocola]SUO97717.1 Cytochrome c5 [Suttonella ornithocola]
MANNYQIPRYVKIIMAIAAVFMPIFLILPFFFWTGTDTQGNELSNQQLQAGRLAPVGHLNIANKNASAENTPKATALNPQKVYDSVCAACHNTGISNAPKFGNHAAWQAKLDERGSVDALAEQAIKGINAMPPKGGTTLSDEDFKKMVAFMLSHADIDTGNLPTADAQDNNASSTTEENKAPEAEAAASEEKASTYNAG